MTLSEKIYKKIDPISQYYQIFTNIDIVDRIVQLFEMCII